MEITWDWRTEALYSIIHESIEGQQHRRPASHGAGTSAQVVGDYLDGSTEGGVMLRAQIAQHYLARFSPLQRHSFGDCEMREIPTTKEQ